MTHSLKPDPANPNRMDDADKARMARALAEFGDLSGIVINRRTGLLVGGHQRADVLRAGRLVVADLPAPEPDGTVARGHLEHVGRRYAVRVVDWPPDKAHAALLAANRYGRVGHDDAAILKELLLELDTGAMDMDLTGYTRDAIEELMTACAPDELADAEAQIDKAAELNKTWGVKAGDLWLIGDHRLLCGDSTKAGDVGRVLGDVKWRSEVNNDGPDSNRAVGKVANDDRADWREAWALFPGDVAYVWHAGVHSPTVAESLDACGLDRRALICWAKQRHTFGRGHYHHQHEPCWYAVRKGGTGHWSGDRTQTTLWQIDNNRNNETGHSTQKPVECMARPMRNHHAPEVYDPFLGSGTTMVAAQNLGRKCYGIEISPEYCAVILQRMKDAFAGIEIRRVD